MIRFAFTISCKVMEGHSCKMSKLEPLLGRQEAGLEVLRWTQEEMMVAATDVVVVKGAGSGGYEMTQGITESLCCFGCGRYRRTCERR